MKKNLIFLMLFFSAQFVLAQEQKAKVTIYNPSANADIELNEAIAKAKTEHKQVLAMVGGNWCKWCLRFNEFCKTDKQIDSILKTSFVFIHINYSPENKNLDLLKKLDFPQRFGFPVLVIIDGDGKRLHTQDSGYLESGEGYDKQKTITFLKNWTVQALDPVNYTK
jgi:thioredoxin-related protein